MRTTKFDTAPDGHKYPGVPSKFAGDRYPRPATGPARGAAQPIPFGPLPSRSSNGPVGTLINRPIRNTGVGHCPVRTNRYASVRRAVTFGLGPTPSDKDPQPAGMRA